MTLSVILSLMTAHWLCFCSSLGAYPYDPRLSDTFHSRLFISYVLSKSMIRGCLLVLDLMTLSVHIPLMTTL